MMVLKPSLHNRSTYGCERRTRINDPAFSFGTGACRIVDPAYIRQIDIGLS